MKKVLSLVLVLMALVAMSTVAFAADVTFEPDADGTYTIPYTEGTSGQFYALLVVEGVYEEGETPAISEDTVLYIDQATANANGDVSFDGWIPKNEEPATVYLGGSNLPDGPVLLGYLGSQSFIVSGTVTSESTREATVTLTDAENNVFTATSVNGAYAVEVPEGTYTFTVNVKNHLSYTDNDFVVDADVSGKNVSVLGGDTDGDGAVAFADLTSILNTYKETDTETDITGDNVTDFTDLTIVLNNYKDVAVAE